MVHFVSVIFTWNPARPSPDVMHIKSGQVSGKQDPAKLRWLGINQTCRPETHNFSLQVVPNVDQLLITAFFLDPSPSSPYLICSVNNNLYTSYLISADIFCGNRWVHLNKERSNAQNIGCKRYVVWIKFYFDDLQPHFYRLLFFSIYYYKVLTLWC